MRYVIIYSTLTTECEPFADLSVGVFFAGTPIRESLEDR